MAARAFGLAAGGHDKASALALIEAFLHEEARAGRRCLLVVDETQNLSIEALEELRMLSNFQLGAHPLLQILLLGQPEFRDLLQNSPRLEQLRQRVIATHHLEAMEPEEVGPYVLHRLACVGWSGNPAFDANVFADLAKATGCLPRRINQVVGRLLLMGAVEQKSRIEPAMLAEVLDDLARDGALTDADAPAPAPAPLIAPLVASDVPAVQQAGLPAAAVAGLAGLQLAVSGHAEQIVELQKALLELADMPAPPAVVPATDARLEVLEATLGALHQRIVSLEARGAEQEQAIRHVLTMLIEWLESESPRRAA